MAAEIAEVAADGADDDLGRSRIFRTSDSRHLDRPVSLIGLNYSFVDSTL